ncbi:hypothetical protein [Brevibacillus choshinensis]|uniref:DNA ligase n=1 Tax=Brevibacillus choshinensis TaxID=54911 RepID=A0ABX7FIC6_BRECH|nr:hypothetical protein [Brevibacillus choshinensis]QRG65528.1 hypothetical protein JNE38_18085 [Brevibacillus choshinensis]
MFSPSQLIQSFVQRAPVTAPKPVELTPGQVFKGTVVKQYPDSMALVQIGGMQVQAKLEAKLEPGQKAWLQVQPSSDVVTLKVLDTPDEGSGKEATMEGLMRSLGLPESKESRVIVAALMNANLPVTKETVQAFATVATRLGTDDATVEAFMMAVKRSLPLTPDTIAGLKAFMADKPVSQVIQNFLQQASQFLENEAGAAPLSPQQADPALRQLVMNLKERVQALPLTISNPGEPEQTAGRMQSQGIVTSAPGQSAQAQSGAGSSAHSNFPAANSLPEANASDSAPAKGGEPAAPVAQTAAKGNSGASPVHLPAHQDIQKSILQSETPLPNGRVQSASANAASTGTQGLTTHIGSVQGGTAQSQAVTPSGVLPASGGVQPSIESRPAGQVEQANVASQRSASLLPHANTAAQTITPGTNPIQALFRQMGIAHEHELMGQTLSGAAAADPSVQKQMDSVKSMLMQLTQAPSHTVPAGLREAADQLLQQVTGQQLMMLQPTNQALSQIVMQIPIRLAQGEETAYVQIESKKKGGGQVDAENCRLFFHLELKQMGTTMIDVSIVNRIVNLQIFNDLPWVDPFIQGMKGGFAEQLHEVGYHLSAVRVQPIPEQRTKTSMAAGSKGAILSEYKGVDLRV